MSIDESPSVHGYTDVEAELLSYIRVFLSSEIDISVFWERYNFLYAEAPSTSVRHEPGGFFFEVNERLHHADWESPSTDPALEDLGAFRRWLSLAIRTYEAGGWNPSDYR